MTQDDVIIEMACQGFGGLIKKEERSRFIAFAKLVTEHEREAFAQLAEEWLGPSKDKEIHIAKAIRARGEQA